MPYKSARRRRPTSPLIVWLRMSVAFKACIQQQSYQAPRQRISPPHWEVLPIRRSRGAWPTAALRFVITEAGAFHSIAHRSLTRPL